MNIKIVTLMVVLAFQIFMLSACSFHVGVDWNGETAKDSRIFTDKKGAK